jgi:hypothetical protein
MENKALSARRLKVEKMMDVLMDMYHMGVDYVDLYGILKEDEPDEVIFSFCKEYMDEEYQDNYDEIFKSASDEEEGVVTRKLTDEDINNLQ